MLATLEARRPLQVDGQQTYSANQTFRLRFNDVTPLEHGETYVRGIELAVDVVLESDLAGTVNVPELVIPRIIETLDHKSEDGHVFLQLPEQAGRALVFHQWLTSGRYPEVTQAGKDGTIDIPNGSTITARLKLFIPFENPAGIEPDDTNVALRDLRNTQVIGRWANADAGGVFDSGSNNERATSATTIREATAVLISRDEYRVAPYPSLIQVTLAGIEEDLPISDARMHYLTEVRTLADGITERFVTDALRDRIQLRVGNKTVIDRVDAKDLVTGWNRVHAFGAADRLDQVEANTADMIPIYYPARRGFKMTHSPLVGQTQPKLRCEGDGNLTTPTVMIYTTRLNKLPTVTGAIRRGRVPVNKNFLSGAAGAASQLQAKSVSKVGVAPGPEGIQTLPIKHTPSGDNR